MALPGLKAGPASPFGSAKLGPDEALEIDCENIRCASHRREEFLKGFVVIQTMNVELDVVAVYTAAGAVTAQVETMHLERVHPRSTFWVPPPAGKPDLVPVQDPQKGFCNRTGRAS